MEGNEGNNYAAKILCAAYVVLCVFFYFTEFHRENTEKHREKIQNSGSLLKRILNFPKAIT